jgi:N-acetylmuramoyl-L-alanine amidase
MAKHTAPRHARHSKDRRKRKHRASLLSKLSVFFLLCLLLYGAYRAGIWLAETLLPQPSAKVSQSTGNASADFRPIVGDPPYRIAVDAGHGGSDPGAIGVLQECDMTALTAQKLIELLEVDANYIPLQTRDSYDTTATAKERVECANEQNADLILSIHGNSAESDAQGFECYPITPGRTWHDESLYFARLLANSMSDIEQSLRGKGGVRYIYYDENDEKILVEATDTRVRTETTFAVLEYANCPSVLAEQCFVTNTKDVEQFGSEEGCEKVAKAYYKAICAYFRTEPQE